MMYTTNLTAKIAAIKTNKHKEINHKPYLTENGQIGNRTKMRARITIRMVSLLFDSVVSNLKDAYFESVLFDNIGSSLFGYLPFKF